MSRRRIKCQCGCGQTAYSNSMSEVKIEEPTDATMRQTRIIRRFKVLNECKAAFEEELGMQQLLRVIAIRWRPRPTTRLQRVNLFRTAWRYARRLKDAHRVMRLSHAIHERGRIIAMGKEAGFKWTRDHAIRTAALFGAPVFLQGFLNRRFLLRAKRRQAKIDAATPPTIQAETATSAA